MSRRRILKSLSAAGFGTFAATHLTVDDVRGAASDEVPIYLDTEGETVEYVSADWYDQVVHTRDVYDRMERRWTGRSERDPHNDVFGLWYTPGKGAQNPSIILSLDKDSPTKDETRGRIPEEKHGVEVQVEDAPREEELTAECDDQAFCCPRTTMPGGLRVTFDGPEGRWSGTLGPRALDNSYNFNYSLTTAAHVVTGAYGCGADAIGAEALHNGTVIGTVEAITSPHDLAMIYDYDYPEKPKPEVWHPENHSPKYTIHYTASKDGVDYFINNTDLARKLGITTCTTEGEIHAHGKKEQSNYGIYNGSDCTSYWYDTVRWGSFTDLDEGDSGSVAFTYYPPNNENYAICSNSWRWFNYTAGPAGYALKNQNGYWWQQS